jgi:hypothetical protein
LEVLSRSLEIVNAFEGGMVGPEEIDTRDVKRVSFFRNIGKELT